MKIGRENDIFAFHEFWNFENLKIPKFNQKFFRFSKGFKPKRLETCSGSMRELQGNFITPKHLNFVWIFKNSNFLFGIAVFLKQNVRYAPLRAPPCSAPCSVLRAPRAPGHTEHGARSTTEHGASERSTSQHYYWPSSEMGTLFFTYFTVSVFVGEFDSTKLIGTFKNIYFQIFLQK